MGLMRDTGRSFALGLAMIMSSFGGAAAHNGIAPYDEARVVVVFRGGVNPLRNELTVPAPTLAAMKNAKSLRELAELAPDYTSDVATNTLLAELGVARLERLFQKLPRPSQSNRDSRLDISRVYRLEITAVSVRTAVKILRRSNSIAYASPDWRVTPMH